MWGFNSEYGRIASDESKNTHFLNGPMTDLNGCLLGRNEEELERETRLELATPTLARSCSTN